MLKLGSLFSGIGAWEKALEKAGIKFDLKFFCENDKYASKAYSVIHNVSEDINLGNITTTDFSDLPELDVLVYSPPCQSFSIAGKGLGVEDERGLLFFDALKVINHTRPKYALMENVKGLTTKKHKDTFNIMLKELENLGYTNYWQVLNAKNYGIPQNRERIFIVSILGEHKTFKFPETIELKIKLKDLLENNVDEKYYIAEEKCIDLVEKLKNKEISNTVCAEGRGSVDRHSWDLVIEKNKLIQIGEINIKGNDSIKRVYSQDGICPTLTNMQGGNRQPKIVELKHSELPCIYDDRDKGFGIKTVDICPTQRANRSGIKCIDTNYRVRKLTPTECFRLMGFTDIDINKCIEIGISNSQLYKMAGNSVVVDVIFEIFKMMFE